MPESIRFGLKTVLTFSCVLGLGVMVSEVIHSNINTVGRWCITGFLTVAALNSIAVYVIDRIADSE